MSKKPLPAINICLIGQKFMGRTHSNAYLKVAKFFDTPLMPVMHTICARDAKELAEFQTRWGWQHSTTNWREAILNPEIQLVDVGVPNNQHREMALAALEAGKHVACEKPLAGTLDEARDMRDAARKVKKKQKTFVWYNYRRTPAVALAHQIVASGKIGRIYHIRGYYLQDWAGPNVPLIWRFNKKIAGSGSHGDLGAHIIDMIRFVAGVEFKEITGAMAETFIKERTLPSVGPSGGIAGGAKGAGKRGKVDVDDAMIFMARMTGGAVCHVEATRFSTGYQNKNGVEIHGEHGAISFNFEDMNWLSYFDKGDDRGRQGWRKINVTRAGEHPYADAWWPDAHLIGYEHGFINQTYDMLNVLAGRNPVVPLPDFEDAYETQRVLEAVSVSAETKHAVKLAEVS